MRKKSQKCDFTTYGTSSLYINILVYGGSGPCVGVCGCAIPRWKRLGTHMNARPPDKRHRAPHARNWRKCVFYYIRHDFSAVFRLGRIPRRSMRLYDTLCHTKMLQGVHPARRAPAVPKIVLFFYKRQLWTAVLRFGTEESYSISLKGRLTKL